MGKTAEDIERYVNLDDKEYLQDLLFRVKYAYENQETVYFKIVDTKKNGFLVKVCGLFAYVPFAHMPWNYPVIERWHNVSKCLIGKSFKSKVYAFQQDPISIILDAKITTFEKPKLTQLQRYRGVIMYKTEYGFFVDIGLHFNWKYGSIVGLFYKSFMSHKVNYEKYKEGDVITVTFYDYENQGGLIFGGKYRPKWLPITKNHKLLEKSIQKVKSTYENQEALYFEIVGAKNNGFLVKVNGVFAYVPFSHMPWAYSAVTQWYYVRDFLVGKSFQGKVAVFEPNPLSILLDARVTTFKKLKLTQLQQYKGVIIYKAKYGLFVDIGIHFDWKYGSITGLYHKKLMPKEEIYEKVSEGDTILSTLYNYNRDEKLILGYKDLPNRTTIKYQHLLGTIERVKRAYENQTMLYFKIVEIKKNGFLVKVSGLFAHISFSHMPWEYRALAHWHYVSASLVGKYFLGKVHSLNENPFWVVLDAKETTFEKPELTELKQYKGVILHKAEHGLFIDIGVHFDWKYGSIVGLFHKNLMPRETYEKACQGDTMLTTFYKYNREGKITFVDNNLSNSVLGKYQNQLEVPERVGKVEKIRKDYEEQEVLCFEIVGVKKKSFWVKTGDFCADVPFYHMPWEYSAVAHWKNVAKYLIGQFFLAKICSLQKDFTSITLDAKITTFKKPELVKCQAYEGVIVHKAAHGLWVDIGLHFNWQYGSIVGLYSKFFIPNKMEYENVSEGE